MSFREMQKLLRAIERAGIPVEKTRSGHFRIRLGGGLTETLGGTPSGSTISALHRLLRRAHHARGRR